VKRRLANRLRALAHRLYPLPGPTLPTAAFTGQVPHVPRVQPVMHCADISPDAVEQMNQYLARRRGYPAHVARGR